MSGKYLLVGLISLLLGGNAFATDLPERQQLWEEFEEIRAEIENGNVRKVLQAINGYLQKDLSKYPGLQAHALSAKAFCYIQLGALDSVETPLDKALDVAHRHGIDSLAETPLVKGMTFTMRGDWAGSIPWFKNALAIARKYQDKAGIVRAAYYLVTNYNYLLQLDSALHYSNVGLSVEGLTGKDRTLLSAIHYTVSDMEAYKGNLVGAIASLFKGYEVGAKGLEPNSYLNHIHTFKLYNIYHALGNFPKALELLTHNIRLSEEGNIVNSLTQKYILRAGLLIEMNRVEEAEEALQHLIQDFGIHQDSAYSYDYHALVGGLHYLKEEWAEAEVHLSKLLSLMNPSNGMIMLRVPADGLLMLARLYHGKGKYQEAIRICKVFLRNKIRINGPHHTKEFRGTLAACYQQMGDFEKAYATLLSRDAIRDTIDYFFAGAARLTMEQEILDQERAQAMATMEMENELVTLRAARQRNLLTSIGLLLISLLVIVYFWGRQRKLALENTLVEVKQQLLKLQVNPHFVFNVLNSIQNSVLHMDKAKSVDLISRFSKLTRQVLENSDRVVVPIHEEIQLLTHYMELEKVRTQHKFDYEIEIDPNIDVYNEHIPSMMLQLFVENAIWHGILPKEEKGLIKLKFTKAQGRIKAIVEDDGIGRHVSALNKTEDQKARVSMGMRLVQERIAALNKKYRKNIELLVQNGHNGKGTEVLLFS